MSENISNTFPLSTEERGAYSWQQKMDVVARYMLLGNMRVVSEVTKIPYDTLADWKRSDWWPEMVDQIRRQKKQKTADGLSKIIENGVDILADRLQNGDFVLNQKTGEIIRKPVAVKDAQTIVNQLIQRQNELEKIVDKTAHKSESIKEVLNTLTTEFQKIARQIKRNNAETIEFKEESQHAVHDERKEGL